MSTAPVPREFDTFDDAFDVDMDFSEPMAEVSAERTRAPLVFTAAAPVQPAPQPLAPVVAAPAYVPEAPAFNPVGDVVAQAQASLIETGLDAVVLGSTGLAPSSSIGEVSVPRIAIHVFAERQDTLAAAERAAQDRRLSRATTQIRVGGVPAAVETYHHEPTPPLIIVECLKDPQTLLWEVDQLAEVCDAGTKVIVVGATNDIILFRELMRRGVSEYLVAPLQPLQLIAAIGGLFNDPAQPFVGRTIAFVGARDRMMVRCTDKLSLFAAPASLDTDWDISTEAFEEVTNQIRATAPFVVLDLPHLWSPWMRRTLISADEVVVVATPDLASLRNAKNMIDLIRQGRPNDAPPRLVLNQVGVPGRPEIPAKDFGAALGVHPSLIIPFDAKTFGAAANNGQMILDAGAKTKAAEAFQTLAQIVSRRELPMVAGPKGKPAKADKAAKPSAAPSKSLFANMFKKR